MAVSEDEATERAVRGMNRTPEPLEDVLGPRQHCKCPTACLRKSRLSEIPLAFRIQWVTLSVRYDRNHTAKPTPRVCPRQHLRPELDARRLSSCASTGKVTPTGRVVTLRKPSNFCRVLPVPSVDHLPQRDGVEEMVKTSFAVALIIGFGAPIGGLSEARAQQTPLQINGHISVGEADAGGGQWNPTGRVILYKVPAGKIFVIQYVSGQLALTKSDGQPVDMNFISGDVSGPFKGGGGTRSYLQPNGAGEFWRVSNPMTMYVGPGKTVLIDLQYADLNRSGPFRQLTFDGEMFVSGYLTNQ